MAIIVIACILLYTYNTHIQEGFGLSDATAPISATFRPIIRSVRQFLETVVKKNKRICYTNEGAEQDKQ